MRRSAKVASVRGSSRSAPRSSSRRRSCGAYNFHPGPPSYPGRFPSCWGSYDGVRRFGATLHVMAERVDEGPIVAVEWFAVEPPIGHRALSDRAFAATVALFRRFAPSLAAAPEVPPDPTLRWSGVKRRHADYEAMCRLPLDIEAAEFARRRRAFADMPDARLTIEVHGERFTWAAPPGGGAV
jgi:methionyl-tRNA formyltransferase